MILFFIGFPDPNVLLKVILALIPVVVLMIGINRHKQKIKLTLFQRRFVIFEKLQELISTIIIQEGMDEQEFVTKQIDKNEIKLLFDKKTLSFIEDIYRRNSELVKLKMEEHPELTNGENKKPEILPSSNSGHAEEENQAIREKRDEIILSLAGDFNGLGRRFKKYLKF